MNFETNRLPIYHVFVGSEEHWFTTRSEMEEFAKSQETATPATPGTVESNNGSPPTAIQFQIHELHEVKTINSGLQELLKMGFDIESLMAQERTGSRTLATRCDEETAKSAWRIFAIC